MQITKHQSQAVPEMYDKQELKKVEVESEVKVKVLCQSGGRVSFLSSANISSLPSHAEEFNWFKFSLFVYGNKKTVFEHLHLLFLDQGFYTTYNINNVFLDKLDLLPESHQTLSV